MQRDQTISGYGSVDDSESLRMLGRAIETGVNFYDTAPWYGNGHSEFVVGRAVRNTTRTDVIISTKVGIFLKDGKYTTDYSGDYILHHCRESLERLGTDYIDVYVLHSPTPEQYRPDGLKALKELKKRRVIRSFGISFPASIRDCEEFFLPLCEQDGVEVVQLSFNLLRWVARRTILPKLASLGIGIVCREPFFYGYLTGRFTEETVFDPKTDVRSTWPRDRHLSLVASARRFNFLHEELECRPAQAALVYCLHRPEISTVIMGTMTVAELNENLPAINHSIEPDILHKIERLQESEDVIY